MTIECFLGCAELVVLVVVNQHGVSISIFWCVASPFAIYSVHINSLITLPPDANQNWVPESSDPHYEGVQKATTIHLPSLSTGSFVPWSWAPSFCVCSHVTNVRASR